MKYNPDAGWATTDPPEYSHPEDEPYYWDSAPRDDYRGYVVPATEHDYRGFSLRDDKYVPAPKKVSHWIECPAHTGQHHWGAYGAAGLMVFTTRKRIAYVLLALRSKGVQSGGSWSGTIGGAIEAGETAWQAAQREAHEEVAGLSLADSPGSVIYECECGWTYTTFAVSVRSSRRHLPDLAVAKGHSSWETDAVAWVRAADVTAWPSLHYRFAQAWPVLRRLI